MATVIEMPEELSLPTVVGETETPEQVAVCESLAEGGEMEEAAGETDGTEQPAEEVASETAETAETAETQPREMVDLIELISDAEHECRAAEELLSDLKEQAKEAKKHFDGCVSSLRSLVGRLVRAQDGRAKAEQPQATAICESPPQSQDQPAEAATPTGQATDDDSWRSVPLADVGIASIKGLGEKKYEALVDLCPTLGAFEDLRARVGRDAASLPELMPRGIGQAICDELEAVVLDWLTKRAEQAKGANDNGEDVQKADERPLQDDLAGGLDAL